MSFKSCEHCKRIRALLFLRFRLIFPDGLLFAAVLMHAAYGNLYTSMSFAVASQIMNFGATFIVVNLSLAFFNLIPIPPLDGSSIIVPFLKGKALANYYRLQQYAMPILIIVLYLLPMWTGIDVIGRYFDVTVYPLAERLLDFAIAGI